MSDIGYTSGITKNLPVDFSDFSKVEGYDKEGNLAPRTLSTLIDDLCKIRDKHGDILVWLAMDYPSYDDTFKVAGPLIWAPCVVEKKRIPDAVLCWQERDPSEKVVRIYASEL